MNLHKLLVGIRPLKAEGPMRAHGFTCTPRRTSKRDDASFIIRNHVPHPEGAGRPAGPAAWKPHSVRVRGAGSTPPPAAVGCELLHTPACGLLSFRVDHECGFVVDALAELS
ncbi:hypothetical protein EVAR_65146_1 [Eumeta japonica]|uniref:Uncharacterized protein n=1 Tax=Eumeta variegata TaxID=151549 RepID=A0A4C1ZV30_EUMVA|nr:hypothetical protein EVAR_65146_1 [Eumeta japonica]